MKSKYNPDTFPLLAEGYAGEGMLEKDIAKKLGLAVSTLEKYKLQYVEFAEALKKGKEPVDFEVERALLKRCLGFSYDEKTFEKKELTKIVRKYYPPDVGAIQTWLSNRKNHKWKRNPDLHKADGKVFKSLSDLMVAFSDEEDKDGDK